MSNRRLTHKWVLYNVLGFLIGGTISWLIFLSVELALCDPDWGICNPIDVYIAGLVAGMIIGICVGFFQYLAINKAIKGINPIYWVGASVIGIGIGHSIAPQSPTLFKPHHSVILGGVFT